MAFVSIGAGVLASAALAALRPVPTEMLAGPPVTDYLIQNLCIDANDKPVAGDPATCTKSRDARPGEEPPYRLSDYDRTHDLRYQTISSLPQADGRILVSKTMETGSGFDLIEREGDYVSIVRTKDGGCGEQVFSGAGDGDGWLLFPTTQRKTAGSIQHGMRLERLASLPQCPHRARVSTTWGRPIVAAWSPPSEYAFESGKKLLTIRTEHRAHHDLSRLNNAMEVFYFTREYGFSRWEAWQPEARCLKEREQSWCRPDATDSPLRGRCDPISARRILGGQEWVRVDCRDTTFFQARPE